MKKHFIFEGLLLFMMVFSLTGCIFGSDDKENEIVEDPLEKTEYYIVGKVSDTNGVVANAKVEVSNDISTTTDQDGVYSLTVGEAKTYIVKFSATGLETYEADAVIASNATNRSQVTLNVKLAEAIDLSKGNTETVIPDEKTEVEVPHQENQEAAATIVIPQEGAEEGTTVTAVAYEEAQAADPATTSPKTAEASVTNVAIETNPADAVAKQDITVAIPNTTAEESEGYFDPDNMTATKDVITTKAPVDFGDVTFENNHYVITIPTGQQIAGKYSAKVKFTKKADNIKEGEYNKVNGTSGVLKLENRNYDAMKDVPLKVETINGWEFTTSPEAALTAIGASTKLAALIKTYIEINEGKEGIYTVVKNLKTNISGNHVLYFSSKAKLATKTYTFKVIVDGKVKDVVVKLTCYVGYTESYTNNPISQHSGGGTGDQN